MKLLARILSHGFAIAVVLLLAVGLIYRGELFPEYNLAEYLDFGSLAGAKQETATGQAGRETADSEAGAPLQTPGEGQEQRTIQATAPESAGAIEAGGNATGNTSAAPPALPEPVAESPEDETGLATVVEAPVEETQQHEDSQPEIVSGLTDESTPATAAESAAAGEKPEAAPDTPEDATAALPESAQNTPQAVEAEQPPVKPQVKAYQLLAAAREAYWLRDYDSAESKYTELTRLEPDNPDGFGELGNMYFSQGQWEQAATAYYEAGVLLVDQGLLEQAEELVAVIRGLNGAHADDLESKVKEASGTTAD